MLRSNLLIYKKDSFLRNETKLHLVPQEEEEEEEGTERKKREEKKGLTNMNWMCRAFLQITFNRIHRVHDC